METLQTSLHALRENLFKKDGTPDVTDSLHSLTSVSDMLKNPALSEASLKKLCFIFRRKMIHLYQVAPELAFRCAATLFIAISDIKVNVNNECRALWEDAQESLLSGVLDFLEQRPTTAKQALVASVFYSPLFHELFPQEDKPIDDVKDSLLCTIFQLLSETAIFHSANQHKLRSSDILGGKRLGLMLAQCRDFLVIEALLELFGNIIPSTKVPERRAQFINDVFSHVRLKCCAKLLEDAPPSGWDTVSTTICDALAKSDIRYPQPFETTGIQSGKVSYAVNRIYIDKSALMASVDKDGQLETFKVPFCTVQRIKIRVPSVSTAMVTVVTTAPPLLGHAFSTHCKDEEISIAFDLKKEKIGDFVTVLRQRGMKNVIEHVHRKQSKAKTDVNLDFRSGSMEFPPLEEKIGNLTRLWQSQWSPTENDPNRTTSPLHRDLEVKDVGNKGDQITLFPTEVDDPTVRRLSIKNKKQHSAPTSGQILQQGSPLQKNRDRQRDIFMGDVKLDSQHLEAEARDRSSCNDPQAPCNPRENIMQNTKSPTQHQGAVEPFSTVTLSEKTQANMADHTLAQRPALSPHVDTTTVDGSSFDAGPKNKLGRRGRRLRILSPEIGANLENADSQLAGIGTTVDSVPLTSITGYVDQVHFTKKCRKPTLKPITPSVVCKERSILQDGSERGGMNENEHDPGKVVQAQFVLKVQRLSVRDPAEALCQEHETKFDPTNNLIASADSQSCSCPSARGNELMVSGGEKEHKRQDRLAEQQVQTKRAKIDELSTLINLTGDGTAKARIGHEQMSLEKSFDHAEEKVQFPIETLNCQPLEQVGKGQHEETEFNERIALRESNLENQGRPSVFAPFRGSNAKGQSKPGSGVPSGMCGSPRKRSCNGRRFEKEIQGSHTGCRIASIEIPSKRRKPDTNVDIRIIEVMNQIHETIIDNIVDKFGGVRKDIYATQVSILEGACDDFLTMRAKSIEHYEQLTDLANQYAEHRRGINDALSRVLDTEMDLINGIKGIIHRHDRLSLSSRFPDIVSPAIPDSFFVDHHLI